MAGPWEEEWTWHDATYPNSGHSGYVAFPAGRMAIQYDPANYSQSEGAARGRLAAAAPEMARMLLELEWISTYETIDCRICGGEKTAGGHEPDCKLVAVLTKAGVLPRHSEGQDK